MYLLNIAAHILLSCYVMFLFCEILSRHLLLLPLASRVRHYELTIMRGATLIAMSSWNSSLHA